MKALFVVCFGLLACAGSAPQQTVAPPATTTTASAEAPPHVDAWSSAVLARSSATATPPSEGFKLLVTTTAISLADGTHLVPVPANASHGVDATYKRNGPNDLYIEPVARVFKTQSARKAILAVDPGVPYRLLVEVIFTLGQNEVNGVELLVRSAAGTAAIEPTLPRPDSNHIKPVSLGLTVIVVGDGISMKARGGNIAPGCKDAGAGLTIPNKDGAKDFAALATCAARLKGISPEFADETSVTVSANPDVDFQTIVATMDALRPAFPNVTFGVTR